MNSCHAIGVRIFTGQENLKNSAATNIFLYKCANQKRRAKSNFYISLNKRPYFTGYMLQILLQSVVMITMKGTRLVQMVAVITFLRS